VKSSTPSILQKDKLSIVVCLAFLTSFLIITALRPSFQSIDIQVNLWTPTIQSPTLTAIAKGIAFVFDTTSLVMISLVISGYLFIINRKPLGLLLLGAMGGDALLVEIIKNIERVARPTNAITEATSFSYPSGHSAAVVVFGGMLAYFAWRHWKSLRSRALVVVGWAVGISIVGFDRVYLNVHWFSDVLGGWLFGSFWLSFVIIVFGLLERAGKFRSHGFDVLANWLYVVAVVVSVGVALLGFVK
jgi:undecaprenyl-diphosphatase